MRPEKNLILMDSIKQLDSLSEYYWMKDDSLSIFYAKSALKIALSLSFSKPTVKAYHILGKAYYVSAKDSSYYYYERALELADKLKSDQERPSILYNISLLNFYAGNYKEALVLLDSCLSCAKRIGDYPVLSDAFNSMGNIYMEIHDTTRAITSFRKALKIGEERSLPVQTANAIGNLALYENDIKKAIRLQKQAIADLKNYPGTLEEIATTQINIGTEQLIPDSAMVYYYLALEELKNRNLPLVELAAYNDLAYSYMETGDISKAKERLTEEAIPLAIKINNIDWLATIYDTYSDVLSAMEDHKNAISSLRKSLKYRQQANSINNEKQTRLLAAIFDLNSKETTIREKEAEIRATSLQNKFLKLTLSLAILVIIIIVFVYIVFRQQMKIKLKQEQINSARRIIELEETEKSRIGLDLHDNAGYLLRITDNFINSINIEDFRIKEQLVGKIKEIDDCIRRISHRINIGVEDQTRLQEIIPDIINDMKNFTGINISYFVPDHLPECSREIMLHMSRIVQELLTNASKYANGSKIRIDLASTGGLLLLFYRDDGPGFTPTGAKEKGIGLSGIKERVTLLGGKAILDSSEGKGTRWEISVPLR
jgi:signal transduction histidine kinase